MEWWPILKRKNGDRIEWSPMKGQNVRAKRDGDPCWRYGRSKSARFALQIGESLLEMDTNWRLPSAPVTRGFAVEEFAGAC